MILSNSEPAMKALSLVTFLQDRLVGVLEEWGDVPFSSTAWLRDEGQHGGGTRYGVVDSPSLGRASVNVSHVHYADDPTRKLDSATALSTIVHPTHPHHPSVHIHVSWTELKSGSGYWRMMADLNPSCPHAPQAEEFSGYLHRAAPDVFAEAVEQGDRYFFIPALGRHRGSSHFYLEGVNSGDFSRDLALGKRVGCAAIEGYMALLNQPCPPITDADMAAQRAYHTLYFFQVLTLDRGTTAGLLVHQQNDIGILGSLPAQIDKNLLASWRSRMTPPQDRLLDAVLSALPHTGVCTVNDAVKQQLAEALRTHYTAHPEALQLQAESTNTPPTLENHQ